MRFVVSLRGRVSREADSMNGDSWRRETRKAVSKKVFFFLGFFFGGGWVFSKFYRNLFRFFLSQFFFLTMSLFANAY